MTQTTKEVFEKYQVRKTKKQKLSFRKYVEEIAKENGYSFQIEKGAFGACNIVVGDIDTAKVVYTAHYDTCVRLPFPNFITPKNFFIYLLYQIILLIGFLFAATIFGFIIGLIFALLNQSESMTFTLAYFLEMVVYIAFIALMLAGPANKNNANDNTSGVITLLDIMTSLSAQHKDSVAFVFFDLEEAGLFGSSSFYSKHKKVMKNKLLINFDCVSDGENVLFVIKKKATGYKEAIAKAFEANENVVVEVASKGVLYPSDQSNFPCGVGVAALKKAKFRNILYMDRIHTKKDTVYREENIEFLRNGAIRLLELI